MGSEDRDRSFEKALWRHWRSASGADAAGFSATPGCRDPEFLAAYHERSLLPEEMNSAKDHIIGCSRCQSILAQLETTDALPLARRENDQERVPIASAEPARASLRGPRWLWLIPAGALAAGLLVWIGFHENQNRGSLHQATDTKVAKVEEPASAIPPTGSSARRQAPPSPSAEGNDAASFNAVTGPGVPERTREGLQPSSRPLSHAKGAPAQPSSDKEYDLLKDAERDSSAGQRKLEDRADLDAKTAAERRAGERAELQSQDANSPAQNQAPYPMLSPSLSRPAPLPAETAKKSKSDTNTALYRTPAAPAPAPSDQVPGVGSSALMQVNIPNPHLIAVSGTGSLWRAGRAGAIDFSVDNGASWARQVSGVLTDLTAGTAPSAQICWIVGRAGTIVLTTDGGAHWSILPSPIGEDWGGVRASDALHATIWNVRRTKSFETSDGGSTWKAATVP